MQTHERAADLQRGLRLSYLSVVWNVGEAAVGIAAGVAAGSVALVGFGLDSVVEASSASIIIWRLTFGASEDVTQTRSSVPRSVPWPLRFGLLPRTSATARSSISQHRLVPKRASSGSSSRPISLVGMPLLAHAKRRSSKALGSHAMHADAKQTVLCTYLSAALLVGLGANASVRLVVGRPGRRFDDRRGCCARGLPALGYRRPRLLLKEVINMCECSGCGCGC